MRRTIVAVAILLAALASGQDSKARITGPVLGYVVDPEAAGVRPVYGIPGAATLGPLLNLGGEVRQAAVAQQADWLLAAVGEERRVTLYRNLSGEVSAELIAEAAPAPDAILLSPAGSAAALLYAKPGLVQVVSGLPEAPAVSRTINLGDLPAGEGIKVWAISDDAARILVSIGTGDAEGVYLLEPDGDLRLLAWAAEVASAAFLAGGAEVVFADGLRNSIFWVGRGGEVVPLAGEQDGISEPVAVSVSRDQGRVFVANAGSGTVAVLDFAGGPPSLVSCDCALTSLERLQGNAVFRLTRLSGEPLWLFDGDGPEARVVFVPSKRPEAQLARQAEGLPRRGGR